MTTQSQTLGERLAAAFQGTLQLDSARSWDPTTTEEFVVTNMRVCPDQSLYTPYVHQHYEGQGYAHEPTLELQAAHCFNRPTDIVLANIHVIPGGNLKGTVRRFQHY